MIDGKEVAYIQKFLQNCHPKYQSYINLHTFSVTISCNHFHSSLRYQLIGIQRNPQVVVN